ncbi:hypothetical protein GCM10009677_48210 [Sphaerisporangium rubeum]
MTKSGQGEPSGDAGVTVALVVPAAHAEPCTEIGQLGVLVVRPFDAVVAGFGKGRGR